MAATNRAAKLAKILKVAKKHYQPVMPPTDRSVIEHLMYACCLQDSTFDAADQAFARLQQNFFDWNEVRVTTAVELAEIMSSLSEPSVSATRLKKTLHSMFETHYTFDIDSLRKENLGKAIQIVDSYSGVSKFVVSYVSQNGLGGHSIGVDKSLINLMYTVGAIDQKEAKNGMVPGMERAIPKNKGVEFFSVVHQLAVAYSNSPFNNDTRAILLSIDSDAKDRFPKRTRKKKPVAEPKKVEKKVAEKAAVKAPEKKAPAKKTAAKKAEKKTPTKKAAVKKASKKTATKKATKKVATKKAAAKKTTKKKATKKATKKKATKSPARRLAKKKPR